MNLTPSNTIKPTTPAFGLLTDCVTSGQGLVLAMKAITSPFIKGGTRGILYGRMVIRPYRLKVCYEGKELIQIHLAPPFEKEDDQFSLFHEL